MSYIIKILSTIKSFFSKKDKLREKEYSEHLTLAIADINSLSIGKVFDLSRTVSLVLSFDILYKCKTFYILQIDILEYNGNVTPYVWLRLDKDLKIQSISKDKEAFYTFSLVK